MRVRASGRARRGAVASLLPSPGPQGGWPGPRPEGGALVVLLPRARCPRHGTRRRAGTGHGKGRQVHPERTQGPRQLLRLSGPGPPELRADGRVSSGQHINVS